MMHEQVRPDQTTAHLCCSRWLFYTSARAPPTGQLNTIVTLHEIVEPPLRLSNLPIPILGEAIALSAKTTSAQVIVVADSGGQIPSWKFRAAGTQVMLAKPRSSVSIGGLTF